MHGSTHCTPLLQLLVVTTVNEVLTVPCSYSPTLCVPTQKSQYQFRRHPWQCATVFGACCKLYCAHTLATEWTPLHHHRSSTSSRGAHPRLTSPTVSMVRHVCSVLLVATAIIAVFPLGAVAGSCTKETPCIVEDRNCEGNDIQAGRSKVRLT